MKQTSTTFLKLTLGVMGLAALAICVFALPAMLREAGEMRTLYAYPVYGITIGLYISVIPFFIALYQAFNLLRYIDHNKAFSDWSVTALQRIKYCGVVIGALYALITIFLFPIADADDAPGLIVIGMVMTGASIVVAVFAAVLQKLVQHAIEIKSENDLTV